MRRDFPNPLCPNNEIKARSFVKIILFKILDKVKYIQPHSTKWQSKLLSAHKSQLMYFLWYNQLKPIVCNSMTKNRDNKLLEASYTSVQNISRLTFLIIVIKDEITSLSVWSVIYTSSFSLGIKELCNWIET